MKALLNNLQSKIELNDELESVIHNVVQAVAKSEAAVGEAGVTLVDDQYIKDLNKRYRDKDVPTDVLSFPDGTEIDGIYYQGDIVVSLERAVEQAIEYGHSLDRELGFLVVHGLLHLLGYDHYTESEEQAMEEKTELILDSVGLSRN